MSEEKNTTNNWQMLREFYKNLAPTSRVSIFWFCVVMLLQVGIIYSGKKNLKTHHFFAEEELFYGTVIKKMPEPTFYKGSVSGFKNTMLIDFDSLGSQTLDVSDKTWMTTQEQERVGFYLNRGKYIYEEGAHDFLPSMCGMIIEMEIFILVILVVVWFFVDLVPFINYLISKK